MAKAQNFRSSSQDRAEKFSLLGDGRSAKLGWQMQDYNPAGAAGNAAAATAAKGRAVTIAIECKRRGEDDALRLQYVHPQPEGAREGQFFVQMRGELFGDHVHAAYGNMNT